VALWLGKSKQIVADFSTTTVPTTSLQRFEEVMMGHSHTEFCLGRIINGGTRILFWG